MTSLQAETLAIRALEWLVSNEDLLPVFMGASGADLDALRAGAGDADFLASVLDFILMDDRWVSAMAAALNIAPDQPMRARQALPGAEVHWT